MAENSGIEWTRHTWNPWRGCTKVSAGCANCYAEAFSGRNPKVLGVWGPSGTRVVAAEAQWREPLKWNRAAEQAGERHRVFCASLADVFEQWDGPMVNARNERLFIDAQGRWTTIADPRFVALTMDHVRERLLFLIRDTPDLDWLLLTKRPESILGTFGRLDAHDVAEQLPNLWLGTSVENQAAADARIPHLLAVPAAVRFLSCEPLLGAVDLTRIPEQPGYELNALRGQIKGTVTRDMMPAVGKVDWVIVGGESGTDARPMNLEWARSLVAQCKAAGVACFVKQLGACPVVTRYYGHPAMPFDEPWTDHNPKSHTGGPITHAGFKDRKGGDIAQFPADLRVREFPPAPAS